MGSTYTLPPTWQRPARALACFCMQIPVGHVEAGLRTHDIYSPWPEEFSRQAVDIVSEYYFSPTEASKQNLLDEASPSPRSGSTEILASTPCAPPCASGAPTPSSSGPRAPDSSSRISAISRRKPRARASLCASPPSAPRAWPPAR